MDLLSLGMMKKCMNNNNESGTTGGGGGGLFITTTPEPGGDPYTDWITNVTGEEIIEAVKNGLAVYIQEPESQDYMSTIRALQQIEDAFADYGYYSFIFNSWQFVCYGLDKVLRTPYHD